MKTENDKTYYSCLFAVGTNPEHATRFPSLIDLTLPETGVSIYDALQQYSPQDQKLSAFDLLQSKLDKIASMSEGNYRDLILWEYMQALGRTAIQFTIRDTQAVSEKAGAFVAKLFELSEHLTDRDIVDVREAMISDIQENENRNFSNEYPGCETILHDRAAHLLRLVPAFD